MARTFAEKVLHGIKAESRYSSGGKKSIFDDRKVLVERQAAVERCLNCQRRRCSGICDFFKR